MDSQSYRDLTLLAFSEQKKIVIACDTSASIGNKTGDAFACPVAVMAAFCVRVPLLELICFGAEPVAVINLAGNEWQPTGQEMQQGILAELQKADYPQVAMNGSTEENMATSMTSLGVTVLGEYVGTFKKPEIQSGDLLLRLGTPYVGQEVMEHASELFSYELVKGLRQTAGVLDMLPVGSKGMAYEAELMATQANLKVKYRTRKQLEKSAGPATVILIAVAKKTASDLLKAHPQLHILGEFF